MNNRTRNQARFAAIASLTLCLAVGCYVEQSGPKPSVKLEPSPELLKMSAWRPPVVVHLDRTADWDKPLNFKVPKLQHDITVPAPVIEPVAITSVAEPTSAEILEEDIPSSQDVAALVEDVEELDIADTIAPAINADLQVEEFVEEKLDPGRIIQTTWTAGEALHGAQIPTPVLLARGAKDGPTLCVTAAVHGDELNGIEAVRRLMYSINPDKLTGTVVGVPIVNLQGFQRHSRYMSDRRDLNRFFPGNPRGSSAARIAYGFFNDVILSCDGLVDLHTGSFHRTNLPQLRADLKNADVLALTKGFGATVILHSAGGAGTLRRAATDAGIPAVTLEAGEPLRLEEDAVDHTVKALFTLLDTMQMYNKRSLWGNPEPTYYSSTWVRADQGGILLSSVKLGKKVKAGDRLGTVTDPISNEQVPIKAPYSGRVIGMALNQFVMPGFATFHLATEGALKDPSDDEHYHAEGMDVAASESMGVDESE